MTFESIYNTAVDVINGMAMNGFQFTPDMTVCVIFSRTGRVYSGVSSIGAYMNGMPISVHAEINAMNNMTALGEYTVDTLILIDAVNRAPMIPCGSCLSYIAGASPDNMNSMVAMPDRMVRFSEIQMYVQGGIPGAPSPYPNVPVAAAAPVPAKPPTASVMAAGGSSKGDLLKGKINDLIAEAGDDDEDDDEEYLEELSKPKKKKFFGLF